jgi:hypothetical protein
MQEHVDRLVAARLQCDVMGTSTLVVARTDAESATLLSSNIDPRDHAYIIGATVERPLAGTAFEAQPTLNDALGALRKSGTATQASLAAFQTSWDKAAQLKTFPEAVRDALAAGADADGSRRKAFDAVLKDGSLQGTSLTEMRAAAADALGGAAKVPFFDWDAPRAREGYYRLRAGTESSIERAKAYAPYCDLVRARVRKGRMRACAHLHLRPPATRALTRVRLRLVCPSPRRVARGARQLWMETAKPILAQAEQFARGVHEYFPNKMLAYNLSPSFNWDAAGMTDAQIESFTGDLGARGFVRRAALASRLAPPSAPASTPRRARALIPRSPVPAPAPPARLATAPPSAGLAVHHAGRLPPDGPDRAPVCRGLRAARHGRLCRDDPAAGARARGRAAQAPGLVGRGADGRAGLDRHRLVDHRLARRGRDRGAVCGQGAPGGEQAQAHQGDPRAPALAAGQLCAALVARCAVSTTRQRAAAAARRPRAAGCCASPCTLPPPGRPLGRDHRAARPAPSTRALQSVHPFRQQLHRALGRTDMTNNI